MSKPLNVLMVEDSENDALLVMQELKRGGYDPEYERVETAEAMSAALDKKTWDIVIGDYSMPHFKGTDALELLKKKGFYLPFIFVSGTIGEERAVEAMRAGAHDYIVKGNLKRLVPAVERELKDAKVRQEHAQMEETIHRMAYYDLLTGLPNRLMLHDSIERAISTAKSKNRSFALLLMDLNHFREINDTLGHHNGDLILQQTAARLQGIFREADTVARLGGDEFAVLLPRTDLEGTTQAIQDIMRRLEEPFLLEELSLNVTASIGISIFPGHGEDTHTLIRRADIAMYVAKKRESGFCVYAPQYDQYSPGRLALMSELRHAIDSDQLFLLYLPKIDLKTGHVIGAEALLRWKHPTLGVVQPEQFIALAEKAGLIKELTFWGLKEAAREFRSWDQAGAEISLAVNLSVRSLQSSQLLDQIEGLLSTWGIAPSRLRLEITEGTLVTNPSLVMEAVTRLYATGIRFSIDDFGTGYSSLNYLKGLPVDEIKIDKSFVMNMKDDHNDSVIVHSIIELGHNLGLRVVAEGVEDKETLEKLTYLGCDGAQGYFISRPIPGAEFTSWLKKYPLCQHS